MRVAGLLALVTVAANLSFAQSPRSTAAGPGKTDPKMSPIVMEEMFVPAKDPGIRLYVRNKHPQRMSAFTPEKTILFVHGATYPSETAFDLPLDGLSWMDYIAQHGYDVYLMDVRGYGHSTRPPQMDSSPDQNPPFADSLTAAADISAVVDYILARRKLEKLDILSWSWGTVTSSIYATAHPDKVGRLVLYGALWIREMPSLVQPAGSGQLGAYRSVNRDAAYTRWMTGVPENKKAMLIPAGWFDQWWDATVATDSIGSKQSTPALRAPNGVVQDSRKFWSAGRAMWDPGKITMPVLMIQAEWDAETPPYMDRALFPLLINAPEKRYIMIGEGTHSVLMEKNRMQLFHEVQLFLDEGANTN
jgi:pimeloyl-ACP methyl ester carboxylesterase